MAVESGNEGKRINWIVYNEFAASFWPTIKLQSRLGNLGLHYIEHMSPLTVLKNDSIVKSRSKYVL